MREIFGVEFFKVFLFIPMYLFLIAVKLEVPALKRLNKLVHNKCIHNAKSVNNLCTRNSCNIIAMGQVIWFCSIQKLYGYFQLSIGLAAQLFCRSSCP